MKSLDSLSEIHMEYKKQVDFLMKSMVKDSDRELIKSTIKSMALINDCLIGSIGTIFMKQREENEKDNAKRHQIG